MTTNTTAPSTVRLGPSAAAPAPSRSTLEANLRAIARLQPDLAERLARTEPASDLEFLRAPDGGVTATRNGRALASKRRPLEEAARVVDPIDVKEHGVFIALGFGVGRHGRALAEKVGRAGVVGVFEPDLPLLRAVLERVDHSAWISAGHVVFFDDPEDQAAVAGAAQGIEAVFGLGVRFVEHGPSTARLGDTARVFSKTVARAVAALRTSIVTTMVQTEITIRNALMNAEHYVARAGSGDEGVADLAGLCAGRPAILVSAGPSLRRNIHLLKDARVRERCVVIAVQTTLKTLLAEGIKPHFVAALDYHEISRRFYEGLTPEDVEGVTLVAEPKVNPAVLDAWPGAVRTTADETLETILPRSLAGEHGAIRPGSTVAHLCHHIARHLGCDPVILTGQDLAFTDGLYYGEGAAIHDVWAAELGPFRTLETLEWERIARMRKTLRAVSDRFGETVFTDEQMATYLAQFEKLFAEDEREGRTVVDASEGGAAKRHTAAMTLAEALERHAGEEAPALPPIPVPSRAPITEARRAELREALKRVRMQTGRLGALCEQTRSTLEKMQGAGDDQAKISKLVDRIDEARRESERLRPAYDLVQRINQTGAFNRARADREINLSGLDGAERQRRQIERDLVNVRWLGDAASEVARLLDATDAALAGAAKLTSSTEGARAASSLPKERRAALIALDPEFDSAMRQRRLTPKRVRSVLDRLAKSDMIDRVIILAGDVEHARKLIGSPEEGPHIDVRTIDLEALRERRRAVAAARAWSIEAWRGGIGGLTVYDELVEWRQLAQIMNELELDSVALLGDDWADLDPKLVDAVVRRRLEGDEPRRLAFSQAAPGRAPVVVSRGVASEFAGAEGAVSRWSTLGGMLGYMPFNPLADPIATPLCAPVDAILRDAPRSPALPAPSHVVLELTRERTAAFGERDAWLAREDDAEAISVERWIEIVRSIGATFQGAAISFAGAGDPLLCGEWREILSAAREAGAGPIHVRTEPVHDPSEIEELCDLADVVSLDLYADSPDAYERIVGEDEYHAAIEGVEAALAAQRERGGLPAPWVVPRMTRCEAASRDVPGFYDRWLGAAGAAVIDPLPRKVEGERFAPLSLPRLARERLAQMTLAVRCDGASVTGTDLYASGEPVASLLESGAREAWSATLLRRGASA